MVDPAAGGQTIRRPGSALLGTIVRRVLLVLLFGASVGIPAIVVFVGLVTLLVGLLDSAQRSGDLLATGVITVIVGVVMAAPGTIFFVRRRRRVLRHRPDEGNRILDYPQQAPANDSETSQDDDPIFGAPAVPPPVAVILPYSIHSRPWNSRPWWLAPVFVVVYGVSLLVRRHLGGVPLAFGVSLSVAIAVAVSALQLAYLYRRRVVVDDLNVSYINMFGRETTVPRAVVEQIALRTVFSRAGHEERLFFLGGDGACVLRVPRFGMTYDEASSLAAILRIPIDPTWEWPTTLDALPSDIPASTTWSERNRLLFGVVLMIPILLFAIGLAILFPSNR